MIGVIVNPRSGYVAAHGVDKVREQIERAIRDVQIHVLQEQDGIESICRGLIEDGADAVAAMGGDGTVNSVASVLIKSETPLGVLPGGTLNHFARDVGIGHDMREALNVLAKGYCMHVDVATVNDRLFLNNSSIGLYASMVQVRERYEKRLGKWRAMLRAGLLVLHEGRSSTIEIDDGDRAESLRTHIVFVGNNQYELDLLHLGRRERLDGGELCCFILEGQGRLRLLPLIFSYFRDTHPDRGIFRSLCTTELRVVPRQPGTLNVSADGEVFELTAPLVYRVLPRALPVIVPKPPPPESREVRNA